MENEIDIMQTPPQSEFLYSIPGHYTQILNIVETHIIDHKLFWLPTVDYVTAAM